jgi:hypothetical protein
MRMHLRLDPHPEEKEQEGYDDKAALYFRGQPFHILLLDNRQIPSIFSTRPRRDCFSHGNTEGTEYYFLVSGVFSASVT